MDVSVIVVSYNSRGFLASCMQSLQKALEGFEWEVFLVDNASIDGGPEEIRNSFPWVKIVLNDHNLGFAKANNRAIKDSKGKYILLLNPDTILHPKCIRLMVDFLDCNPAVGVLGPAVYDDENFSTIQMSARSFPSFSTALFHRYSPISRIWKNNPWSSRYLGIDLDRNCPSRVDWVSACCMMIRRNMLDEIGPLDEDFWMFAEDVDLCRRAWKGGWQVAYQPQAKAVHFIGASKGKVSARVIVQRHRSMWIYYRKHIQKNRLVSYLVLGGISLRCVIHLVINTIKKQTEVSVL